MLFTSYRLTVPQNFRPFKVERFANLQQACGACIATEIATEIANGDMYRRLLRATERPDIFRVFCNLQEASQQRHLPASQR